MIENKKGITLIALVITIIVLLILAGVSIATITGENGILERAKSAKEASENVTNEENSRISQYENEIDNYSTLGRSGENASYEELKARIEILEKELQAKNNMNNLSTNETVIGTWIDGKKLYQKTVELDITKANSKSYSHNIENVENIFVDTGNTFFTTNNGGTSNAFFMAGVSSDSAPTLDGRYLNLIQKVDTSYITIRVGSSSTNTKAYVTLKYTKTTD